MQTVPCITYMDCKSTIESKPGELRKTMQWLLQSWWCGTSRESPCKFLGSRVKYNYSS